jgi:hypothetical protein
MFAIAHPLEALRMIRTNTAHACFLGLSLRGASPQLFFNHTFADETKIMDLDDIEAYITLFELHPEVLKNHPGLRERLHRTADVLRSREIADQDAKLHARINRLFE